MCPWPNVNAAIAFDVAVFGPTERGGRPRTPERPALRFELTIGDPLIILGVDVPNLGAVATDASDTATLMLHLYVDDVDRAAARAEAGGGEQDLHLAGHRPGTRLKCQRVLPISHASGSLRCHSPRGHAPPPSPNAATVTR